jgi:hypothetical protein
VKKTLIAAALGTGVIALAPQASADVDQVINKYLQDVRAEGINGTEQVILKNGEQICGMLATGSTVPQVILYIHNNNGLDTVNANNFVTLTNNELCPILPH